MQSYKSAEIAGILGIVLGGVGALDFYLGNKRKAMVHVGLWILSLILVVIDVIVLPLSCSVTEFASCAWMRTMMEVLVVAMILGNFLWGVAEGIWVLLHGDEGLAQRGHQISNSRMQANWTRSVVEKNEGDELNQGIILQN